MKNHENKVPCQLWIPKDLHYKFKLMVTREKLNIRKRILELIKEDVEEYFDEPKKEVKS